MKLCNLLEQQERKDTVTMTIPLLIKLMEWAREEAKSDIDIHELVEQLVSQSGVLDTDDFDQLMDDPQEDCESTM